jgi:hypothetical protein
MIRSIAAVLLSCVALAGCATNKEFYAVQEKLIDLARERAAKDAELKLERQKTRTAYMTHVAPKLDASGAAALGVTMALSESDGRGSSSTSDSTGDIMKMIALQRPPESWDDKALKWAAVLVPGLVQGAQIFASRDVSMAQIAGNTEVQKAMMAMIAQINADTGNAVARAGDRPAPPPTYQITLNGDGNGLFGGNGETNTDNSSLAITCSSTGAPGGAGAQGGVGAVTTQPGSGGPGGAGAGSPVNCTVSR